MKTVLFLFFIHFVCGFEIPKNIFEFTLNEDVGIEYKFHRQISRWSDAVQNCMDEDAILATPKNSVEAHILKVMFNIFKTNVKEEGVSTDFMFLGFHDTFLANEFVSVRDESIDDIYNSWRKGSPSSPNTKSCGAMDDSGKLANILCSERKTFICEKRNKTEVAPVRNRARSDRGYIKAPELNKSYKIHLRLSTWDNARAICNAEGGYLAIPKNKEEYDFIQEILADHVKNLPPYKHPVYHTNSTPIYIGMHNIFHHQRYVTVLGEDMIDTMYDSWDNIQYRKRFTGEYCGGIVFNKGYAPISCSKSYNFMCERYTPNRMITRVHYPMPSVIWQRTYKKYLRIKLI